jgi:putative hydrolase of HD superfamily
LSELEGFVSFLKLAGKLKKEPRRGWIAKAGISNPESVADHSFRLSLIVMLLGDFRNLDTEKMIKMALIHDLGESLTGDLIPSDGIDLEHRKKNKEKAMKRIFKILPIELRSEYIDLWNELSHKSSEEAKLVSESDKLEMAIQANEYMREGYPKKSLEEFNISALKSISDRQIAELFHLI